MSVLGIQEHGPDGVSAEALSGDISHTHPTHRYDCIIVSGQVRIFDQLRLV